MNLLHVDGLTKSFKKGFIPRRIEILKGMSFSVPAGTVTGFLGANGAGKTTTMRCVLGLDFPDSGKVEFFGGPLTVEAKKRIGFLPERPYFYEHLTGVEFLEFYASLTSTWNKAVLRSRILELLKRVNLDFAKDRLLRNYSKGMLQKIGLAQALIHEPELVILDEPMSGLDPDGRAALAELITETAKKGPAIFFSSHLMHDTERLCERLVVLKGGKCIYEGSTQNLLDQSTQDFEVTYLDGGTKRTQKLASQDEVQSRLKVLVQEGATIFEVRRNRASLEDIFVSMALRGSNRE